MGANQSSAGSSPFGLFGEEPTRVFVCDHDAPAFAGLSLDQFAEFDPEDEEELRTVAWNPSEADVGRPPPILPRATQPQAAQSSVVVQPDMRASLREARDLARDRRAPEARAPQEKAPQAKAREPKRSARPTSSHDDARSGWGTAWRTLKLGALGTVIAVGLAVMGLAFVEPSTDRVRLPVAESASDPIAARPLWSERPVDRALWALDELNEEHVRPRLHTIERELSGR